MQTGLLITVWLVLSSCVWRAVMVSIGQRLGTMTGWNWVFYLLVKPLRAHQSGYGL